MVVVPRTRLAISFFCSFVLVAQVSTYSPDPFSVGRDHSPFCVGPARCYIRVSLHHINAVYAVYSIYASMQSMPGFISIRVVTLNNVHCRETRANSVGVIGMLKDKSGGYAQTLARSPVGFSVSCRACSVVWHSERCSASGCFPDLIARLSRTFQSRSRDYSIANNPQYDWPE